MKIKAHTPIAALPDCEGFGMFAILVDLEVINGTVRRWVDA